MSGKPNLQTPKRPSVFKFNRTIIPFAHLGYELVFTNEAVPFHFQRALIEYTLIVHSVVQLENMEESLGMEIKIKLLKNKKKQQSPFSSKRVGLNFSGSGQNEEQRCIASMGRMIYVPAGTKYPPISTSDNATRAVISPGG